MQLSLLGGWLERELEDQTFLCCQCSSADDVAL